MTLLVSASRRLSQVVAKQVVASTTAVRSLSSKGADVLAGSG
jgi:hypothetical protein